MILKSKALNSMGIALALFSQIPFSAWANDGEKSTSTPQRMMQGAAIGITGGAIVKDTADTATALTQQRIIAAQGQQIRIKAESESLKASLRSGQVSAEQASQMRSRLAALELREKNVIADLGKLSERLPRLAKLGKGGKYVGLGSLAVLAGGFMMGHLSWHRVDVSVSDSKEKRLQDASSGDSESAGISGSGRVNDAAAK